MKKVDPFASPYEYTFINREHVLFTSLVTLCAALLFLLPNFPFPVGYLGVCIASCVFHLILFLIFDRISSLGFNLANLLNLFMLALSVHYTGGILSPFTSVFVLILISGSGYGLKAPLAVGASIGFYCAIIFAEKYGYIEPVGLTSSAIYQSWPATLFVMVSVVMFMLSSGSIYKITVDNLRGKIARELEIKIGMERQLSSLVAPSQVGLVVNKIVHDMRGPLTSLGGFIHLLREENDLSEESQKDCDVFLQELGRVNNLINGMLKFVKPGETERETLFPPDVIENVLSVISFFPGAKEVTFSTEYPPVNSFHIFANKHELQQVFFNIFKNSIEAFEPSSRERQVRITVTRDAKFAVVSIADNGPGIPESILSRLTKDTVSTKEQGSGVGLVIVRDIIEGHGGSLTVQSHVGHSTRLIATFPIHQSVDN